MDGIGLSDKEHRRLIILDDKCLFALMNIRLYAVEKFDIMF
ncbi:hypothetical protein N878_02100 [Pseudomonas sp. EGD-AK9]|nr:hypothetical protein N878_02100 [Pseudomonas sp. EGD-AK9]